MSELSKPVDWDELYPGRFLKAGTLRGQKVTLTITEVAREKLASDKGERVKGVLSFERTEMQLALNKTNGICLKGMFGRILADWIGKRVTLFADQWNGEACIRVWGSPDIERDAAIEVQLPRRKPFTMTMHALGQPSEPPREQDAGTDPETGETAEGGGR